jgi:hypothetical protein
MRPVAIAVVSILAVLSLLSCAGLVNLVFMELSLGPPSPAGVARLRRAQLLWLCLTVAGVTALVFVAKSRWAHRKQRRGFDVLQEKDSK